MEAVAQITLRTLWLYVTGLMVLLGLEINAVLARMTESSEVRLTH